VYGTPFFIQAGLPLASEKRATSFDRLTIAQDTGSAIVGPARADIYWGAGDLAGRLAGRVRDAGSFAMLVPRELDPVAAGARMPFPPTRPAVAANAGTSSRSSGRGRRPRPALALTGDLRNQIAVVQRIDQRPRSKPRMRWGRAGARPSAGGVGSETGLGRP